MHIHATQASAAGNALAGAQAAETSAALRRARELKEAAARLRASILSQDPDPGYVIQSPETTAQTVSLVAAWTANSPGASSASALAPPGYSQPQPDSAEMQPIQRSPASAPVSYSA